MVRLALPLLLVAAVTNGRRYASRAEGARELADDGVNLRRRSNDEAGGFEQFKLTAEL